MMLYYSTTSSNKANIVSMYFISDLHLCQKAKHVDQLFKQFINNQAKQANKIFILGDLFNVWLGDDLASSYALDVAHYINQLHENGIACFFMPGNRDFLLGSAFANLANMKILADPCQINSSIGPIVLTHGDALCTKDRKHQWFRKISQHQLGKNAFLRLSKRYREAIGNGVRRHSASHARYCNDAIDLNLAATWLKQNKSHHLIHGHIHQAGIHHECIKNYQFTRYVMGSWEDSAWILQYNNKTGLQLLNYPD